MFRLHPPVLTQPHSLILAIDDATFSALGGVRAYRTMLARALELLAPVQPKVVAIDMVLADKADSPEDDRLRRAMQATRNLVLVAHLQIQNGHWEDPLDEFRRAAAAVGHDGLTNSRATVSPGRSRSNCAPIANVIGHWRWRRFGWRAERRFSNRRTIFKSGVR